MVRLLLTVKHVFWIVGIGLMIQGASIGYFMAKGEMLSVFIHYFFTIYFAMFLVSYYNEIKED